MEVTDPSKKRNKRKNEPKKKIVSNDEIDSVKINEGSNSPETKRKKGPEEDLSDFRITDDEVYQRALKAATISPKTWSMNTVGHFLHLNGLPAAVVPLERMNITGEGLMKLNRETLAMRMDVKSAIGVFKLITKLRNLETAFINKNMPVLPLSIAPKDLYTKPMVSALTATRIPKRDSPLQAISLLQESDPGFKSWMKRPETYDPDARRSGGAGRGGGRGGYNGGGGRGRGGYQNNSGGGRGSFGGVQRDYQHSSGMGSETASTISTMDDDEDWGAGESKSAVAPPRSVSVKSEPADADDEEDWGDKPARPATSATVKPPPVDDDWGAAPARPSVKPAVAAVKPKPIDEEDDWGDAPARPLAKPAPAKPATGDEDWGIEPSRTAPAVKPKPADDDDWGSEPAAKPAQTKPAAEDDDWGDEPSTSVKAAPAPAKAKPAADDDWEEESFGTKAPAPSGGTDDWGDNSSTNGSGSYGGNSYRGGRGGGRGGGGGGGGDRPPMTCYNCQKEGHGSRNCPDPPKPRGGGRGGGGGGDRPPMICYNCNKEGHGSRNCPDPQKPRGGGRGGRGGGGGDRPPMICYNCNKEGHGSRNCPDPQKPRGGGRGGRGGGSDRPPMTCYNCQKEGHGAFNCPEPAKPRGGGRGGRGGGRGGYESRGGGGSYGSGSSDSYSKPAVPAFVEESWDDDLPATPKPAPPVKPPVHGSLTTNFNESWSDIPAPKAADKPKIEDDDDWGDAPPKPKPVGSSWGNFGSSASAARPKAPAASANDDDWDMDSKSVATSVIKKSADDDDWGDDTKPKAKAEIKTSTAANDDDWGDDTMPKVQATSKASTNDDDWDDDSKPASAPAKKTSAANDFDWEDKPSSVPRGVGFVSTANTAQLGERPRSQGPHKCIQCGQEGHKSFQCPSNGGAGNAREYTRRESGSSTSSREYARRESGSSENTREYTRRDCSSGSTGNTRDHEYTRRERASESRAKDPGGRYLDTSYRDLDFPLEDEPRVSRDFKHTNKMTVTVADDGWDDPTPTRSVTVPKPEPDVSSEGSKVAAVLPPLMGDSDWGDENPAQVPKPAASAGTCKKEAEDLPSVTVEARPGVFVKLPV